MFFLAANFYGGLTNRSCITFRFSFRQVPLEEEARGAVKLLFCIEMFHITTTAHGTNRSWIVLDQPEISTPG